MVSCSQSELLLEASVYTSLSCQLLCLSHWGNELLEGMTLWVHLYNPYLCLALSMCQDD